MPNVRIPPIADIQAVAHSDPVKLISSADTLHFLSQVAPRAWVQRMLRWMILDGEIEVYFAKGLIQPFTNVEALVAQFDQAAGESVGLKMNELIRRAFSPNLADKLVGREWHERVNDAPVGWTEVQKPRAVDPGFVFYATDIDWIAGTLSVDWLPSERDRLEALFPTDELLVSKFENAEYEIALSGMSFPSEAIEMLLPSAEIKSGSVVVPQPKSSGRPIGRPPKWDWDGAMAFVVSQAQLPDGLPTGAGSQARIEQMIEAWFFDRTEDTPSISQIRQRAATIVRAIDKSKGLKVI